MYLTAATGRCFHLEGLIVVSRIYMYRHAVVDFDNSTRIHATAFRAATDRYDAAPIAPFEASQPIPQCDHIVASTLPRSRDTAIKLFGTVDVSDDIFREAELPDMPRWPLTAKPTTFFAITRVLWLCGRSTNCETQSALKERVDVAADILMQTTQDHGSVGFIGHGLFNRYLLKALRVRGFNAQDTPSHTHGTYTLLTKA